MKDILAQGGQFTWKGGLNNCRMARLDRFLISANRTVFLEVSTKVSSLGLLRITSPFCLKGEGEGLQALPLLDLRTCGLKRRGSKT